MKIYRKELFDGLEFPVGRLHEDLYITYQLLDRCKCFVFLDAQYYFYFQNPSGICLNYTEQNFNDECDACFEIYSFFKDGVFRKEVLYFLVYQLLDSFSRAAAFIDDINYSERKEKSIKWIRKCVWEIEEIPLTKKIFFILFLRNMKLFVLIRKIRNMFKKYE